MHQNKDRDGGQCGWFGLTAVSAQVDFTWEEWKLVKHHGALVELLELSLGRITS